MTSSTISKQHVVIRSAAGAAALTLSNPLPEDEAHPVTSFLATLEFKETFVALRGATRTALGDGSELIQFFASLARDAAGFVGVREWASRERELVLRADHDGSTRIILTVMMRPEYDPPPFTAEYRLRVPVTALTVLVDDVARFVRAG